MARTIQSPGVEIREFDFSLGTAATPPTTVFVPGFAAKGPSSEPISITSISEFETIFGTPTNSAERYFYHTTKAILQSPASVLVYRVPYGTGAGLDTSDDYSALVYPVASYVNGASSTNLNLSVSGSYFFGAPTHIKLTQAEYLSILRGDGFLWSSTAGAANSFSSVASFGHAGMVVLNKAQSIINDRYEGSYFGIIDNTNLNPATPYNDIGQVLSLNSNNTTISGSAYVEIPSVRMNFPLSADQGGVAGSISEVIENIPTFDISSSSFDDTVTIGVFKLRQSVFSPDTIALDYVLQEGFVGSFDFNRQINNVNGGPAQSFFIEQVDNTSTNATVLVNPYISDRNGNSWLGLNGIPKKKVRFLSSALGSPLAGETTSEYEDRVGAPVEIVQNLTTDLGRTDALFALGDYAAQNLATKEIGNVPNKLSIALDKINNADLFPINLVVEAGLGTVYVNSFNPRTLGYFDDSIPYDSMVNSLTAQSQLTTPAAVTQYNGVANAFLSLTETRKDLLFIADPLTNIFVQGSNVKTLDLPTNTFSNNIYWPLKNQFANINTSYATTFANVVKVTDVASSNEVWVPFSGFAAAAMANTDSNYQPWYAPAGFTRGILTGVNDIAIYPKQKQRDSLYKTNLNPVTFFPAEGFVIFGQKTLQKNPSAFDRINVRRLFLSLETSTRDTVKYFVFEPNTLFTRTQVLNALTPIYDNAKNTQGIYDYLIVCDERNNPPSVIDDNSLVVDIYIKPVRTAEYILCNFYATRTGTSFQEIVS
ncbi:hypothetical protein EBR43_05295 [bacterium]|nr:hypothetical protein [bacterium]